jgi:hypothetical protein
LKKGGAGHYTLDILQDIVYNILQEGGVKMKTMEMILLDERGMIECSEIVNCDNPYEIAQVMFEWARNVAIGYSVVFREYVE